MWIPKWLGDRIGSFFDIGKGMEVFSMYSPVLSVFILVVTGFGAFLVPVPPALLTYPLTVVFVIFGYVAGDKFQYKMDDDPAEESVQNEMSAPMPYIQFQTLIIAIWLASGIIIWRIIQGEG